MTPRVIQIGISIIAIVLTVLHMTVPAVGFDAIAVTLMGLAVLPWLGPLFRSVELPGGLKITFKDLAKVQERVEESGLFARRAARRPMEQRVYAFQAATSHDPNLALAGLRLEIESRLKKLAVERQIDVGNANARRLTEQLETAGALTPQEAAAIHDLLPLLNRAVHGAKVDSEAFSWATAFGPQLLQALDDRLGAATLPILMEAWKNGDGAAVFEVGRQLSKAFVSSPHSFLAAMEERGDEFKGWLDGIDTHTFTVHEARDEIEGELYEAYYKRLKELMLSAADSVKNGSHAEGAKAITAALHNVEVRRIW